LFGAVRALLALARAISLPTGKLENIPAFRGWFRRFGTRFALKRECS